MQDNPSARLYTVQIYVHFQVVGLRIFFKKEFIYYVTNPVPKKQCKSVIFHYSLGGKRKTSRSDIQRKVIFISHHTNPHFPLSTPFGGPHLSSLFGVQQEQGGM
jgi:hypothetical protein